MLAANSFKEKTNIVPQNGVPLLLLEQRRKEAETRLDFSMRKSVRQLPFGPSVKFIQLQARGFVI